VGSWNDYSPVPMGSRAAPPAAGKKWPKGESSRIYGKDAQRFARNNIGHAIATKRKHLRMQQFFHNFSTIAAIFPQFFLQLQQFFHPYVFFFLANNDDCCFFAKRCLKKQP